MIVTLSGNNDFLIRQESTKLKKQWLAAGDSLNVDKLEGFQCSLEELVQCLSAYSLFSPNKIVIVDDLSNIKGFDERYEEILTNVSSDTNVLLIDKTLDKRTALYKYLLKHTDFRSFSRLSPLQLVSWVMKTTESLGGKINRDSAIYLLERVGDDQLLLSQELRKLLLFNKDISHQTIDIMTETSASSTIFQLLDAIFDKNLKKAMAIYNQQRLQKVEPEQIMAMISWQLQILALYMTSQNLKDGQVVTVSGVSPYTMQRAAKISAKISYKRLKLLISELVILDYKSKTVGLNIDDGLKNYIVSLAY